MAPQIETSGVYPIGDNLFISGFFVVQSGGTETVEDISLYLNGGVTGGSGLRESSNIPLMMNPNYTGDKTLYTTGHIQSTGSRPLFLETNPIGNLDLFIGSSVQGTTNWRNLYTSGKAVGTVASGVADLFTEGSAATITANVDLFVQGLAPSATLTLYVAQSGSLETRPLYVSGDSFGNRNDGPEEQDGYIPVQNSLDLFINRVNEVDTLPLYLEAAKGINSSLDLIIPGQSGDVVTDSIYLFTEGLPQLDADMTLYTRGGI